MGAFLATYNQAATFDVDLQQSGSTDRLTGATLVAGDVRISIDGAALTNLTNLPVETPANSGNYPIVLTAAELTGQRMRVVFEDQTSPKEWEPRTIYLHTLGHAIARMKGLPSDVLFVNGLPAAPGNGSGTGPLTRTVTVTSDGVTPVVGADVGMTGGFSAVTDALGQVVFNHVAGTFTIVAAKNGYAGVSSGPLNLTATGSTALTMPISTVTPSADPAQTTAFTRTRNPGGTLTSGLTVYVQLRDPTPSATGVDAYSRKNLSDTSGADFLAEFALKKGGTFRHKLGDDGPWSAEWTIPADAGATWEMPEVLGKEGA